MDGHGIAPNLKSIWLPDQSQLQEMYIQTLPQEEQEARNAYIVILDDFIEWVLEKCNGLEWSFSIKVLPEQLWLAFVMKEKYNKIWNGEDWDVLVADGVVTMGGLIDHWIYLGEYAPGEITIQQSFHLDETVTNWAQTDECTFSEGFLLQQINAPHPENCLNCDDSTLPSLAD